MKKSARWLLLSLVAVALVWGGTQGIALASRTKARKQVTASTIEQMQLRRVTNAQRRAAGKKLAAALAKKQSPLSATLGALRSGKNPLSVLSPAPKRVPVLDPTASPDYYTTPNYATSPLPLNAAGDPATETADVVAGTGMRKFVDSLPGLTAANTNNLGQFLPVAVPDQSTYPGADYYVIALCQYSKQLHSDLPKTTLRGYVQLNSNGTSMPGEPNYLGPTIIAQKDRAVRVKFINKLPTGADGNLFLPVDKTIMGAGMGPQGGEYTENRATLHLHGGLTPWISDGTPHQWTTPANEDTPYQEGVSVSNVPDMDGGNEPTGTLTFYYSNQQSARLMFYHDHTSGLTRLNVYAGEAAGYLLQDPVEKALVEGGQFKSNGTTFTATANTIPSDQMPLIIQDKSFVPTDSQLAAQDPTWDKAKWGGLGSLWLPHVYMPNQMPSNDAFGNELYGVSAMGRWDYNPWFYPPVQAGAAGSYGTPIANPYWGQVGQPDQIPGTPTPTIVPESFMDTPMVNGTAYPFVKVGKKAYRFRVLNACDDRFLNLQLYFAKSNGQMWSAVATTTLLDGDAGEVTMTPAYPHQDWPSTWPTDGRDGGVPDPSVVGPSFIQIGNEGGFLPSATVLPNNPVGYEYFRRTITVLSVTSKTLYLGPAERADVIVDFSQVPDGTKLIMYNDAPSPMPAFDARLDYYTGDPDQTEDGGAPTTLPGYGPNTRTVMQFQVDTALGNTATPFNLAQLQTGLQAAYGASQDKPIVPQAVYGPAFNTTYKDIYGKSAADTLTFTPPSQATTVTIPFRIKAIMEGFDPGYGRMNANLGGVLPNLGPQFGAVTPYDYTDPVTEVSTNTIPGTQIGALNDGTQIWRIDHEGVDTHAIHFHLANVQLISRIAIDGQLFVPDDNELGWKETIRMNPGQDVLIAMRPMAPTLPFKIPNSKRLLNPAVPEGGTFVDSLGTTITNAMANFGWEYVWHCHLLGHEENDMMRPFAFIAAPAAPTNLRAITMTVPARIRLRWTRHDTWPLATNYFVQRATNPAFTSDVVTYTLNGRPAAFYNASYATSIRYYYRVRSETSVGYSDWSNAVTVVSPAINSGGMLARTNLSIRNTVTRTAFTVQWTNPVGGTTPTNLRIEYKLVGVPGPWTQFGGLVPITYTARRITGLLPNTRYWARVVAVNGAFQQPSAAVNTRTLP